jgi:hypothetical protein
MSMERKPVQLHNLVAMAARYAVDSLYRVTWVAP